MRSLSIPFFCVVGLPASLRLLLGLMAAVLALLAPVAGANAPWIQRGADINGTAVGDLGDSLGSSVAVSANGLTLVAGAPGLIFGTVLGRINQGQVQVFVWNGLVWEQRGESIVGFEAFDFFGFSVAVSADGLVIAVGAPGNDDAGFNVGQVQVFAWNGERWEQRGANINGAALDDRFGFSVAISADGSTIAASAPFNDQVGPQSGQVRVFAWDGAEWVQRGDTFIGAVGGQRFGDAVAVNVDGSTLVVGALGNADGRRGAGEVRVFDWDGSQWDQRGMELTGTAEFDVLGESVAISSDGLVVAAGAPGNDAAGQEAGQVRVFEWNGSVWEQRGLDLNGTTAFDGFGVSVAISADGLTVAGGSPPNDTAGVDAGQARAFAWDGVQWEQRGMNLNGTAADDLFGSAVAVNADGLTLISGAPGRQGGGVSRAGRVQAYYVPTSPLVEHIALTSVTAGNASGYLVTGTCSPLGELVSVSATDGSLPTPAVSTQCNGTGFGAGVFEVSVDLSPLAAGTDNITITSTIANAAGTASDSDNVSKVVPAALCNGSAVTIIWGSGAVATSGNDVIWGTNNADTINAIGGDDTVCGRGGNDTINGGNGVDVIFGGEGNDTIGGQGGNDRLEGEAGADVLNGGPGNDELFGGEGEDDLRGQSGADTLEGGAGVDQFFGGSGNDTITTGPGGNLGTDKVVRGQGNNDTIIGSSEADDLEGGPGLDELFGRGGNDRLRGGNGADRLLGESGADTLEGGAINDDLLGGPGDDILRGGTGDDDLFGEGGDDTLDGQGDIDDCDGGSTGETLGDSATNCETTTGIE